MVTQYSPVVLERLGLIVCTRDRTASLVALLDSIAACGAVPKVIVVVDSNLIDATALAVASRELAEPSVILYLRSKPGLPYQRNLGVAEIINSPEFRSCEVLAFLDDDVEVFETYFSNLLGLFDDYPNVIGIGGIDGHGPTPVGKSLLLRAAMVTSRKDGVVLPSGFATLPNSSEYFVRTEWFPGFAMAFRRKVFESHRFDDRLAFYGEDLEFQLRIRGLGDLMVCNRLQVRHKAAPTSRDSIRDKWSYSDGFRWALSRRSDNHVNGTAVIYSTVCLLIVELLRFLVTCEEDYKLACWGHVDFLSRLIRREEVQKLRRLVIEKGSSL